MRKGGIPHTNSRRGTTRATETTGRMNHTQTTGGDMQTTIGDKGFKTQSEGCSKQTNTGLRKHERNVDVITQTETNRGIQVTNKQRRDTTYNNTGAITFTKT